MPAPLSRPISPVPLLGVVALVFSRPADISRLQFHFATVLSPWIRRALVAGGFGTGTPSSRGPTEIAPVVPYRGGRRQLGGIEEQQKTVDIESLEDAEEDAPISAEDTPYFHFDLAAAVRAAELGLVRRQGGAVPDSETSSLRKAPEVTEASRSDA